MKTRLLVTFFSLIVPMILSSNSWGAGCLSFETELEKQMAKALANETAKVEKAKWGAKEALEYKTKYKKEVASEKDNRTFMNLMKEDKDLNRKDVLYFDVENSVQKTLNDVIVGDKGMVDALNNSFMNKFYENLQAVPELKKSMSGLYKDYKPTRARFVVAPGEEATKLEVKLNEVFQKTNAQFAEEFHNLGLSKLIPPRTDGLHDPSRWFLSGTGENALEANMAARSARALQVPGEAAKTVRFANRIEAMFSDINFIEKVRTKLALDQDLIKAGIMAKTKDGKMLPSKDMIAILRKIKPDECATPLEYATKIRAKVKNIFGSDMTDGQIDDLTVYFKKVDSLSPPIFQREQVRIDLGKAKEDIVSVDFTGIGVDNAYEQMRALSSVNYLQTNKEKLVKDAFDKIDANVNLVTEQMNEAKRFFTEAVKAVEGQYNEVRKMNIFFSGDDGIYMPSRAWTAKDKEELAEKLATFESPAKFRVTHAKTRFNNGDVIPTNERSQRIVRAEEIEKKLREAVVGLNKVKSERAEKMIFAVDSASDKVGGKYTLLISGKKPTPEEEKMIVEAFKKTLDKEGESFGGLTLMTH